MFASYSGPEMSIAEFVWYSVKRSSASPGVTGGAAPV